jgi:hypothetical protein
MIKNRVAEDRFRIESAAGVATCLRKYSAAFLPFPLSKFRFRAASRNRLPRIRSWTDAITRELSEPCLCFPRLGFSRGDPSFDGLIRARRRSPGWIDLANPADRVLRSRLSYRQTRGVAGPMPSPAPPRRPPLPCAYCAPGFQSSSGVTSESIRESLRPESASSVHCPPSRLPAGTRGWFGVVG